MERMTFLTLDEKGIVASVAVGILLFLFGWGRLDWSLFLLAEMVLFLVTASVITVMGRAKKKREGIYERKRGIKNVAANALAPLVFGFAFLLGHGLHIYYLPVLALIGFIGSVAATTADKFSSEIGVLNGRPRMIIGFRKVRKGTSGGVTWLGLTAGLLGAMVIAVVPLAFFAVGGPGVFGGLIYRSIAVFGFALGLWGILLVCTAAGFVGTVVDSLLGYFETRKRGSKHLTNFLSSLIAGLIAILIFVIIML